MNNLVIISKEEAYETGEITRQIKIPVNGIQSIDICKAKDSYWSSGSGFTGSLTITETNSQITELVFRDSSKSEIKRYTDLKGKLITELNLAINNAHNQSRRSA